MKKHQVELSQEERNELEKLTRAGTISVRKLKRIRILLLSDEGASGPAKSNKEIADMVAVSPVTVSRIRKRFVEEGLEQAINEKPKSGAPRTFSGDVRAKITALACSDPPEGNAQWSLRLLADKMVELEYVDSISHMTIREVLKKRPETTFGAAMVPGQADDPVFVAHGAGSGSLQSVLRPETAPHLCG